MLVKVTNHLLHDRIVVVEDMAFLLDPVPEQIVPHTVFLGPCFGIGSYFGKQQQCTIGVADDQTVGSQ